MHGPSVFPSVNTYLYIPLHTRPVHGLDDRFLKCACTEVSDQDMIVVTYVSDPWIPLPLCH